MDEEPMDVIRSAAKKLKVVYLEYESPSTGKYSVDRPVEPYEIKDGYFWGYDRNEGSIKKFALEGILGATITQFSYSPRWPVKIF